MRDHAAVEPLLVVDEDLEDHRAFPLLWLPLNADLGLESLELAPQVNSDLAVGMASQPPRVFLVTDLQLRRRLGCRADGRVEPQLAPCLDHVADPIGKVPKVLDLQAPAAAAGWRGIEKTVR